MPALMLTLVFDGQVAFSPCDLDLDPFALCLDNVTKFRGNSIRIFARKLYDNTHTSPTVRNGWT